MKYLILFFLFPFLIKTENSFFEKSGFFLSKITKEFKSGYFSDQIKKRKDEISLRLKIIKKIFEKTVNLDELEIIINYYEKYINENEYSNFILNDENFSEIIKKLDSVIAEKDFQLFFSKNIK